MTLWETAPWLLFFLSAILAIAAAWPPFHVRRMIAACVILFSGMLVLAANGWTTVQLPTRVAIVAECAVYRQQGFAEAIAEARRALPWLSKLGLMVLGPTPNAECPVRADLPAVSLSGAPTLAVAMAAVDADLSSEPILTTWRARRIVLFGETGGPISQGQPIVGSDRERYIAMLERHRADIEYRRLGDPVREMRLSAPLWRVSDPAASLGMQVELVDPRMAEAKRVSIEVSDRTLDAQCTLKTYSWDFQIDDLKNDPTKLDEHIVERPAANLLVLRVRFGGGLSDSAWSGRCGNGWWSLIEARATVTLEDGNTIDFSGQTMPGRSEQPALTLVTPLPGTPEDRRSAVGWESNGLEFMSDGSAGPGLSQILRELSAPMISRTNDNLSEKWPLAVLWRTIKSGCWFTGASAVENAATREKFRACLRRTKRLAVITPTAADILSLERTFDINRMVGTGRLHTLVASPEYTSAATVATSPWAAIDSSQTKVMTTAALMFSPSRNALLTRGADATRFRQEAIFDALMTTPYTGIAEPPSTCNAAKPIIPPRERPVLAWFSDVTPVVPEAPHRQDGQNVIQARLRGTVKYSSPPTAEVPGAYNADKIDRFGTARRFEQNLLCNHPVKRLVDAILELKQAGLLVAGRSYLPRATIMIVEVAQKFPPISKIAEIPPECSAAGISVYHEDRIRQTVAEFLGAGGKIIVQPLHPALPFDENLIDAAVDAIGGGPGLDLEAIMKDAGRYHQTNVISILPAKSQDRDPPKAIADQMLAEMFNAWSADGRLRSSYTFSADDGVLSDRRDRCAYDLDTNTVASHCAFSAGEGRSVATALNRLQSAPEFYRGLVGGNDALVSGSMHTGNGEQLRSSRPIGLGWAHFLGYSPLSRNDIGHASQDVPETPLLKTTLCYLYLSGLDTQLNRAQKDTVAPPVAYGGVTMLDRFARALQEPIGEPRVDAIEMDDRIGAGAFTLVLQAAVDDGSNWNWRLQLADAKGNPFPDGGPASLIFKSFDPRTGEARIRVEPRASFEGGLTISFTDLPDGSRTGDITVPVAFVSLAPQFSFEESIDGLSLARSAPARLMLDSSATMVLALALNTLVLFSPLARRWVAPMEAIRAALRKDAPSAWFPPRAAPLFSVQAALAEFGLHPGRPAAARNAGLPAGIRNWRSGDSGRSIATASLYPLVGRSSALPPARPKVYLKTASEAASALILVEGTGALLSPPAGKSPSKADFAAALTAFIAGAVSLSHGRGQVARVGLIGHFTQDGRDLGAAVRASLDQPASFISPVGDLQTAGEVARLVIYVCDGLSLNTAQLEQMAEVIAADGGSLRVAVIVSSDDGNAAMLRRDPRTGAFEDDSETHPATFLAARDRRVAKARVELERRGGVLMVVFDAHMGTQEVLQRVDETGFLK